MSERLCDRFGRQVDTLRISLTDRCNLRCLYCMPAEGVRLSPRSDLLSFEEIVRLARCFIQLGVRKIKLTGGEPLVRKGVVGLVVKGLSGLSGLEDLTLTTNGVLLTLYAEELKKANLKRVNISLDTLRRKKFEALTGSDRITQVLAGIELALSLNLTPVKVNVVLLRGINDDEIIDFVNLTRRRNLVVRFIEFMPTENRLPDWTKYFIGRDEILKRIKETGRLVCESEGVVGCGPAEYFQVSGHQSCFGIISPISKSFCQNCNRIRINARGELIPCLHHGPTLRLKELLKTFPEGELLSLIKEAVLRKPSGHSLKLSDACASPSLMCQIGG